MVPPTPPAGANESIPAPPPAAGPLRALLLAIRTRIISGLVLALPIVLTFWIVYWLYTTLTNGVLDPLAQAIGPWFQAPWAQTLWWKRFVNPLIAGVLVLCLLYFLGWVARSWVSRVIEAVLLRVPVVTTIYQALSNVFQSLADQFQQPQFQRVVLVAFPHPGSRALAFVTNSLRDAATGKTILSVCVLTGVFPPAGFTLFFPEESVTELDWSVNETLQTILSGGITAPATIHFSGGGRGEADAHRDARRALNRRLPREADPSMESYPVGTGVRGRTIPARRAALRRPLPIDRMHRLEKLSINTCHHIHHDHRRRLPSSRPWACRRSGRRRSTAGC